MDSEKWSEEAASISQQARDIADTVYEEIPNDGFLSNTLPEPSTNNVKVVKEPGFVVVSLSKVVEISSREISMICMDGIEYELELLDTVFSPTPRDEYMREIVRDIILDSSDSVENLFEINKEIFGANTINVRRDDWTTWCDSYRDDLVEMIGRALPDIEQERLIVETIVIADASDLLFVVIAEADDDPDGLESIDDEEIDLEKDLEDDEVE